jgi:hypothetical protein
LRERARFHGGVCGSTIALLIPRSPRGQPSEQGKQLRSDGTLNFAVAARFVKTMLLVAGGRDQGTPASSMRGVDDGDKGGCGSPRESFSMRLRRSGPHTTAYVCRMRSVK